MEHLRLRIKKIRQETADSKTFFLEGTDNRQVTYKAGQFLTLIVEFRNKEIRRSYSISSTPGVDTEFYFTVKRIENGEMSRYLLDELKEGDVIVTLPPTGKFTIEHPESKLVVFIAAGSGITPVFSLIKQILYQFYETNILLINQNHSEKDSIFRDDLLELQRSFTGRFFIQEVFSRPVDHQKRPQRLNNSLLERILAEHIMTPSVKFFLCGPAAFMRMAVFTLKVMQYTHDKIRQENFFAIPPPPPPMLDQAPHKVTIYYHHKRYTLDVRYPHNILEVALKNHIQLPYSCRGGRCSTCTARCTSGKVKMTINDVLTPKDLQEGLILTCVSYPETDVELSYEML